MRGSVSEIVQPMLLEQNRILGYVPGEVIGPDPAAEFVFAIGLYCAIRPGHLEPARDALKSIAETVELTVLSLWQV